jgi:hypothetical protein
MGDFARGVELWDVQKQFENRVKLFMDVCPSPNNDILGAIRMLLMQCEELNGVSCKMTVTVYSSSRGPYSACQRFFFPLEQYWIVKFVKYVESLMLKADNIENGVINIIVCIKNKPYI